MLSSSTNLTTDCTSEYFGNFPMTEHEMNCGNLSFMRPMTPIVLSTSRFKLVSQWHRKKKMKTLTEKSQEEHEDPRRLQRSCGDPVLRDSGVLPQTDVYCVE